MRIRSATPADALALAPLLEALGYPADAATIGRRLEVLARHPGPITVLVAAPPEGSALLGLVTAHAFPSIHQDAMVAWLTTLVVAPDARGRGVGRGLVAAVEGWARQQGAVRISLTSGAQRDEAHAFYTRLGYAVSGRRFSRSLVPPGGA